MIASFMGSIRSGTSMHKESKHVLQAFFSCRSPLCGAGAMEDIFQLLPADAPAGHIAHRRVRHCAADIPIPAAPEFVWRCEVFWLQVRWCLQFGRFDDKDGRNRAVFRFKGQHFQTSVAKAGTRHAAEARSADNA